MCIKKPLFTRVNDDILWHSLSRIAVTDFEILHIKHPGCGEFESLQGWSMYFYKYLRGIDRTHIFINDFSGSARQYIQHHARIIRGECV